MRGNHFKLCPESHSCAPTDEQLSTRLSCCAGGENFFGQLGDNSTNTSAVPVQVATNLSFEAIVGAWPQSCWEQAGVLRPLHLQECRPYYQFHCRHRMLSRLATLTYASLVQQAMTTRAHLLRSPANPYAGKHVS